MSFLMSDILTTIRDLAVNELGDLGNSEDDQNSTIFRFVNIVLDKRAAQANNIEFSDVLSIAADGDQTFQKDSSDISDLYQPLEIYAGTKAGATIAHRTSFEAPKGWIREADNEKIHTKGITGDHVLKYVRYPANVDASSDTVEFPRAGKWDLIMDVVALCKLPKNYYDEAAAVSALANGTSSTQATKDAKGK